MTEHNDANDDTRGQNYDYSRGDRFAVKTDPTVAEVVVLETITISGYVGVMLAEKDARTGEWASAYPNKAQYLKDEQNLGLVESREALDEEAVQGVELAIEGLDAPGAVEAPEGVTEVPSLD